MCAKFRRIVVVSVVCLVITVILTTIFGFYQVDVIKSSCDERTIKFIYFVEVIQAFLYIAFSFCLTFLLFKHFKNEIYLDPLTGLGNRKKMFEDINKLIEKKSKFKLCYIDFNSFKSVNDNYGHDAGDRLLKRFSTEVNSLHFLGVSGYRVGGDEFVIIIKGLETVEALKRLEAISNTDVNLYNDFYIKLSFAIGTVDNDYVSTAKELINRADESMYVDKYS